MALLLETTLGDLVIDLDVEGSPALCKNVLQLAQSRYYSQTLIYNIQANRFCQLGDPHGDGSGGGCWQAVVEGGDVTKSTKRFFAVAGTTVDPPRVPGTRTRRSDGNEGHCRHDRVAILDHAGGRPRNGAGWVFGSGRR